MVENLKNKIVDAWIFDVDGTLANPVHRKHFIENKPKRWDLWNLNIDKDTVNQEIADFVEVARAKGIFVIIATGREEKYRVITRNWLYDHNIFFDSLMLRKNGDYRSDDIIKKEMLDRISAAGINPVLVFDDRDRVVKMWRENGIRCFQVAEGDF